MGVDRDHVNRGDGTCAYCFEEWPCPVSEGKAYISGVQAWAHETNTERHLRESLERAEKGAYMIEVFKRLGYDIHISKISLTVTVDANIMHAIAQKLDEHARCG